MLRDRAWLDMSLGRPTKALNVTAEEKEKLTMLARRRKSCQAVAMRARIVHGCEEGMSNTAVANKLHVTGATVCKWRECKAIGRSPCSRCAPSSGCRGFPAARRDLRKNGETPEPGALDGEADVRVFIQKGSIVPASICSDYACSSRPNLEG
jgi:hypothetical protein